MSTYGLPPAFAFLRLSRGLLRRLHATIVLWRRLHRARGAIAGDIDLANGSDVVASIQAGDAAGSIVVGHLQVPGKTTRGRKQLPKRVRAWAGLSAASVGSTRLRAGECGHVGGYQCVMK